MVALIISHVRNINKKYHFEIFSFQLSILTIHSPSMYTNHTSSFLYISKNQGKKEGYKHRKGGGERRKGEKRKEWKKEKEGILNKKAMESPSSSHLLHHLHLLKVSSWLDLVLGENPWLGD